MSIRRIRNTNDSVTMKGSAIRAITALLPLIAGSKAVAQSSNLSNFSIYGRLNMSIEHYCSENPAVQSISQNALGSWGSHLDFHGSENLGDNGKAVFEIESGIRADDGRPFLPGAIPLLV